MPTADDPGAGRARAERFTHHRPGYPPTVPNDHPVRVTPYQDGPYLIRGPFELLDQDGNTIETGRRTIALCRCGRSQTRPFCDGTHKLVGFAAPSGPEAAR